MNEMISVVSSGRIVEAMDESKTDLHTRRMAWLKGQGMLDEPESFEVVRQTGIIPALYRLLAAFAGRIRAMTAVSSGTVDASPRTDNPTQPVELTR